MLGGRLYDPATMNEVVTGGCKRTPYWWEGASNGGDSGATLTTGHGHGDWGRD